MATQAITRDNLASTIEQNDIVFLDFWAGWCGPCIQFGPVFERVSEKNSDIVFGKIDTEAEQELAAGFRITSIPTLMAFREGILVYSQPGSIAEAQLDQLVDGVRGIDMAAVHADIAAKKAAEGEPS